MPVNFYESMFQGVYTALVTPFTRDGKFDRRSFRKIVEKQIESGIDGLVAVGTTGESPTVTHDENLKIIEDCISFADGRTRVVAGTGSNSTEEAVFMTKRAARMGADAALLVCPYYNKPPQEGLYRHFREIAQAVPELQIVLYDIPGRTGVGLAAETVIRLAEIPNIVALKDATGNMEQIRRLRGKLPEYFSILSGDDGLTLEFMQEGANGVISVASNLRPAEVIELVRLARDGNWEEAKKTHERLLPFFDACFCETNPIPIKTMMAMAGMCEESFRLPLCEASPANRESLKRFI